ncbi:MAG: hypothetical protein COU27_00935, partial [Candidatus Levybacteria bacterium CG10_big_fil_rev_8_21_14_0_10_36_7]
MSSEQKYYIKGMHCPSCEILIEKKILEIDGVKAVEVSLLKSEALIEYEGKKPDIGQLNNFFTKDKYEFFFSIKRLSESKSNLEANNKSNIWLWLSIIVFSAFLILWATGKMDWIKYIRVDSKSSLLAFFVFGTAAGFSSCAALVGGIVLSLSKQWLSICPSNASFGKKIQPHLLFNIGRIISYTFFGVLLGLFGGVIRV